MQACTHLPNLAHGHGVDQSLDVFHLHEVPAGVEDDSAMGELRPVADPDVVEDDEGAGHVVILHELEEGLQTVTEAEVVDGRHVGGQQGPLGSAKHDIRKMFVIERRDQNISQSCKLPDLPVSIVCR